LRRPRLLICEAVAPDEEEEEDTKINNHSDNLKGRRLTYILTVGNKVLVWQNLWE
jgi:hypothetical protein